MYHDSTDHVFQVVVAKLPCDSDSDCEDLGDADIDEGPSSSFPLSLAGHLPLAAPPPPPREVSR